MHLENTISSVDVTDERISICNNDAQKPKAAFSIDVTEVGIVICSSDLHFKKVPHLIVCKEVDNDTRFKEKHCSNAKGPNEVTDEGIVISFNNTQPVKAYCPIEVTNEGIVISFNNVQ